MKTISQSAWAEKRSEIPKGSTSWKRDEYFGKISTNKNKIIELYNSISSLNKNGDRYIFYIEYNEMAPKSIRPIFNDEKKLPEKIKDVCQRDVSFENENFRIFYELSDSQYENLLKIFSDAVNDELTKPMWKINNVLAKLLDSSIIGIFQTIPNALILNLEFVKLIYIDDDINELKERMILRVDDNFIEETTSAYLTPSEYDYIIKNKPWMILKILSISDFQIESNGEIETYDVSFKLENFNKTHIGVIDSGINLSSELTSGLFKSEDRREFRLNRDIEHGSIVTSIIIAHDEINFEAPDGLGNFMVSHFEIFEPQNNGDVSCSFQHMINEIKNIVIENKFIKVWNLSFGTMKYPYFTNISQLGVILDKLAIEHDLIFIVAAGNDRMDDRASNIMETLNMPADSYNSISVGSVSLENDSVIPSEFSSMGSVLHYEKPEVSHWGDVMNHNGTEFLVFDGDGYSSGHMGTSFSAPKVTRIIASFIEEGLNTIEAKAKLISLAKRETPKNKTSSFGYVSDIQTIDQWVDLKTTRKFINNKPQIVPIELINGIEEIVISTCHKIIPMKIFGDESSIHNFESRIIVYDVDSKEPIQEGKSLTVSNSAFNDTQYAKEKVRRLDSGKYFNSKKAIYKIKDINAKINELHLTKNIPLNKIGIAIRVKRLDLFNTIEEQVVEAGFHILIKGNFDEEMFYKLNDSILEVDVEVDV